SPARRDDAARTPPGRRRRPRPLGWLAAAAITTSAASAAAAAPSSACERPLPVLRDGRLAGDACPDELSARGLTQLDLGDAWVPYALGGAALAVGQAPPAYAETFVALAAEKFAPGSIAE